MNKFEITGKVGVNKAALFAKKRLAPLKGELSGSAPGQLERCLEGKIQLVKGSDL